jgi:hypothetical protein
MEWEMERVRLERRTRTAQGRLQMQNLEQGLQAARNRQRTHLEKLQVTQAAQGKDLRQQLHRHQLQLKKEQTPRAQV